MTPKDRRRILKSVAELVVDRTLERIADMPRRRATEAADDSNPPQDVTDALSTLQDALEACEAVLKTAAKETDDDGLSDEWTSFAKELATHRESIEEVEITEGIDFGELD